MMQERSERAYELRKFALSEAAKASNFGSLPAKQIVERAKAYYEFLKGEEKSE